MKKTAVIALTEKGCILGEKIASVFTGIDLLTIKERKLWDSQEKSLSTLVKKAFSNYDALIFIMATGIVVRMIAAEIVSKDSDPAVIVIDEQGKNSISLVSGHLGGGNSLTLELSDFLNNNPVITTATDVNDIYAIDSFARDHNLKIEPVKNIKIVNSALLEGKKIDIVHDAGIVFENNSFKEFNFYNFQDYSNNKVQKNLCAVVSNKIKPTSRGDIFLRPLNLIIGTGCKKYFPAELFEKNILLVLEENNLSINSIKEIRSISIKKEEDCIVEFANKYKIPFKTFSADELNKVFDDYNELLKSEFVFKNTGTYGVAEPSALISEKKNHKLLSFRKELDGMTIAISEETPFHIKKSEEKWLIRKELL